MRISHWKFIQPVYGFTFVAYAYTAVESVQQEQF